MKSSFWFSNQKYTNNILTLDINNKKRISTFIVDAVLSDGDTTW